MTNYYRSQLPQDFNDDSKPLIILHAMIKFFIQFSKLVMTMMTNKKPLQPIVLQVAASLHSLMTPMCCNMYQVMCIFNNVTYLEAILTGFGVEWKVDYSFPSTEIIISFRMFLITETQHGGNKMTCCCKELFIHIASSWKLSLYKNY